MSNSPKPNTHKRPWYTIDIELADKGGIVVVLEIGWQHIVCKDLNVGDPKLRAILVPGKALVANELIREFIEL